VSYGRVWLKRLQKLEVTIRPHCHEADLQSIRMAAWDTLAASDRTVIAHMARKYAVGEEVENTTESEAVLARWREAIARLLTILQSRKACGT
jgi:hypothetical protein